jgi:hypothetical protein
MNWKIALLVGIPLLLLACAGLVGGIFYWVLTATGGAAEEADRFFTLLGQGKVTEAYQSTATAFRGQQNEEDFTRVVKELGLNDYASASWSNRSVRNNQATLKGTVQTKSGGSIPLEVNLVYEGGQWKVLNFNGPVAGGQVGKPPRRIPSNDELQKLTAQTLLDFNQAIQDKDFTAFHRKGSTPFREQLSPAKLQMTFQKFIDLEINLGGIKNVEPIFDQPPEIDKDGNLALSGYYPTKPFRVRFHLKYTYEHPAWKLIGIQVKTEDN